MGGHGPLAMFGPLGVDGDHDALLAETFGRLTDEFGIFYRRGVDRDLIAASEKQTADIL